LNFSTAKNLEKNIFKIADIGISTLDFSNYNGTFADTDNLNFSNYANMNKVKCSFWGADIDNLNFSNN
jgi:hypothetical protein